MAFNLTEIIDRSADAARLDAALVCANQYRTIAIELRREAQEYDTMADKVMARMKDEGDG